MDDAYHTLEALSLKNGLQAIEGPDVAESVKTNGVADGEATHQHTNGFSSTQNTNGTVAVDTESTMQQINGFSAADIDASSPKTNGFSVANGESSGQHTNSFSANETNGTIPTINITSENVEDVSEKSLQPSDKPSVRHDSLVPTTDIPAPTPQTPISSLYYLLTFSAHNDATLKRILSQYTTYYSSNIHDSSDKLSVLAHTLATRRTKMTMRAFTIADPSETPAFEKSDCVRSALETHICFIFTGQGAQYVNMGLELMRYPVFASILSDADKILSSLGASWSLFDKLASKEVVLPQFSQPICTILQVALFELLSSFGIKPEAVVGHSSGEIAAAYAIGALTLEGACKASFHRGRLSAELKASGTVTGAMMSVNIAEGNVRPTLDQVFPETPADIHVACSTLR